MQSVRVGEPTATFPHILSPRSGRTVRADLPGRKPGRPISRSTLLSGHGRLYLSRCYAAAGYEGTPRCTVLSKSLQAFLSRRGVARVGSARLGSAWLGLALGSIVPSYTSRRWEHTPRKLPRRNSLSSSRQIVTPFGYYNMGFIEPGLMIIDFYRPVRDFVPLASFLFLSVVSLFFSFPRPASFFLARPV